MSSNVVLTQTQLREIKLKNGLIELIIPRWKRGGREMVSKDALVSYASGWKFFPDAVPIGRVVRVVPENNAMVRATLVPEANLLTFLKQEN